MTDQFNQLVTAIMGNDAFKVGAFLSQNPELVGKRDPEGRTPILLALYFRNEPMAELIRERTPAPDLFEAAALGETELVAELLKAAPGGANAIAPDGFGVLGLSVYFGRAETAKFLLEAGANPNTSSANQFKVRPIHSAAANLDSGKSFELVKLLLDGGADPNVSQAGGWTPLHQAAAHGRGETAEMLVKHGASLTAKSDDGRTPLEMARAKGHEAMEPLLGG